MPSPAKRRKLANGTNDDNTSSNNQDHLFARPLTAAEKSQWQGFCEIESEPAFFNVMLQEFGVRNVKVREVFSLDPDFLAMLPQPIHALIFLFRYRTDAVNKQQKTCPEHIWFANQSYGNACATVALLNIINNIPDVEMGEPLRCFKDFTTALTPPQRGDAIGNFEFVKSIHNSFARKMDMLNADLSMKNEFDDRNKPKKKNVAKPPAKKKQSKGQKVTSVVSDNDFEEESEDDNGFHFITFLPIDGEVWKLDGLDRQPAKLGIIQEDWLSLVLPDLTARMAEYEEGQIEFSLLSLVQDPVKRLQDEISTNSANLEKISTQIGRNQEPPRNYEETSLTSGNGQNGISAEESLMHAVESKSLTINDSQNGSSFSVIQASPTKPTENNPYENIDSATLELLRENILSTIRMLEHEIEDERRQEQDDQTRTEHRRHDYGPLIHTWLKMLAEKEGLLQELVDETR